MPENQKISVLLFTLYTPFILSFIFQGAPVTSYLIAWLGSFFIFFQTWFSSRRSILKDMPIHQQIMRPLFLQQFIFAGFMCCTSVFFFLDTLGYRYSERLNKIDYLAINESLQVLAFCQRLSVLGHAALVSGIILIQKNYNYEDIFYTPINKMSRETWLVRIGVISFIISLFMQKLPGLFQFSLGIYNVAVICGALILIKGITQNNIKLIGWGGTIFIINLLNASLTGYKEPIITSFIILGCLLYPYYKNIVITLSIPFFILLFYVAPTYSSVVRQQSWHGTTSAEEARSDAIETLLEDEKNIEETNWDFLTGRFSEIGMFTQFVNSTPDLIPYYHTEILQNALVSIIPRALWKGKPITEEIAMQRVYDAGVIDSRSKASAKTRPIVDGYLSYGTIGVFLYMFIFGMISQALCNQAERLFGGYETGCIIFFNGFYQILWRGETTEFMVNSIFWGFVAMMILLFCLRFTNYLEKASVSRHL